MNRQWKEGVLAILHNNNQKTELNSSLNLLVNEFGRVSKPVWRAFCAQTCRLQDSFLETGGRVKHLSVWHSKTRCMGMTLSSQEAMDSGAQYISCVAGASFVKEGRNFVDTRASFLSSRVFPSLAKRNLTKIKKLTSACHAGYAV